MNASLPHSHSSLSKATGSAGASANESRQGGDVAVDAHATLAVDESFGAANAAVMGTQDDEEQAEYESGGGKSDSMDSNSSKMPWNSSRERGGSSECNSREGGSGDASDLTPPLSSQSTANTALASDNTKKKRKMPRMRGQEDMPLDSLKVFLNRREGGCANIAWGDLRILLRQKGGWRWPEYLRRKDEFQWVHVDTTIMKDRPRLTENEVKSWARDNLGWVGKRKQETSDPEQGGRERKARRRVKARGECISSVLEIRILHVICTYQSEKITHLILSCPLLYQNKMERRKVEEVKLRHRVRMQKVKRMMAKEKEVNHEVSLYHVASCI